MKPIRNVGDYLEYKAILYDVDALIRYYSHYQDDMHNDDWRIQKAKRRLLKTKYQALGAKGGGKISIDTASNQQINSAFRKSFSKRNHEMPDYLRTITKSWYETRIRNYEAMLRGILPKPASLSDLISAEQLAKEENNTSRAQALHSTIEQKLGSCSPEEIKAIKQSCGEYGRSLSDEYSVFKSRQEQ